MLKTTQLALMASIIHWFENETATRVEDADISPENCALCSLFFKKGCRGCPVKRTTHQILCDGSPYPDAAKAYVIWRHNPDSPLAAEDFRKLAKAERKFLQSLLP